MKTTVKIFIVLSILIILCGIGQLFTFQIFSGLFKIIMGGLGLFINYKTLKRL